MFQTGSRLLVGAAVLATVAAIAYGVFQGGALGTTGLIIAATALTALAGVNMWARDSDVSAMDESARTRAPAALRPPGPSTWPLVAAVGGVLLVVGIVSYPVVFIFGVIALLAATAEWMVQAWSERASADAGFNAAIRTRIAHPLEFPVLAAIGFAIIVYSFSRIMLFLSKTGGVVAFAGIALLLLLAGFVIAFRPSLRTGAIAGVATIAALGLVAGGAVAALEGEREVEAHETVGDLAALGECSLSEETEADENASQSVSAKANLAGRVILQSDDDLIADNAGVAGAGDAFVVTRANPTNVLFVNNSTEDRRLFLDLGTRPEVDETGAVIEGTAVPWQFCTALVEDGGRQLMTFSIPTASAYAVQPYRFLVPGVEGAEVAVVVP
ncbi:MAG: hypothetical protein ACR2HP_10140 [Ilumatobacteraceae bacterium]